MLIMKKPGGTTGDSLAAGRTSAAIAFVPHYELADRSQDVSSVTAQKPPHLLTLPKEQLRPD